MIFRKMSSTFEIQSESSGINESICMLHTFYIRYHFVFHSSLLVRSDKHFLTIFLAEMDTVIFLPLTLWKIRYHEKCILYEFPCFLNTINEESLQNRLNACFRWNFVLNRFNMQKKRGNGIKNWYRLENGRVILIHPCETARGVVINDVIYWLSSFLMLQQLIL